MFLKPRLMYYKNTKNIQMLAIISLMFGRKTDEYLVFQKCYADLLLHWGLMEQRCEIQAPTVISVNCENNLKCALCRLPIK
jgi:hypothetical protein